MPEQETKCSQQPPPVDEQVSMANAVPDGWTVAAIGADRSSFMRCGGGPLCNEAKN